MALSHFDRKNGRTHDNGHEPYVVVSPGGLEYRVSPYRRGAWIAVRVRPDGLPRREVIVPDWPYTVEQLWEVCAVDYSDMLPSGAGGRESQVPDKDFEGKRPMLWWLLTSDKLPDGKPRKRASLSFTCQSDGWAAFLNEKQSNCYLCRSGATLEDCLDSLELALLERPVAWRTNGTQTKRR